MTGQGCTRSGESHGRIRIYTSWSVWNQHSTILEEKLFLKVVRWWTFIGWLRHITIFIVVGYQWIVCVITQLAVWCIIPIFFDLYPWKKGCIIVIFLLIYLICCNVMIYPSIIPGLFRHSYTVIQLNITHIIIGIIYHLKVLLFIRFHIIILINRTILTLIWVYFCVFLVVII